MAATFDRTGIDWQYEPQCFADETGQYLPDFLLGGETYVEIKPLVATSAEIATAKKRMEIIFSSEPDAVLWIVATDGDRENIDHGRNFGDGQGWVNADSQYQSDDPAFEEFFRICQETCKETGQDPEEFAIAFMDYLADIVSAP